MKKKLGTRRRVIASSPEEYRNEVLRRKRDWARNHRRENIEHYRIIEDKRRGDPKRIAYNKAYRLKYKEKHPFKSRATNVSEGISAVTASQLYALYHKQGGRCALSGKKLNRQNIQLDHAIPLCRGGSNTFENVRWVCKEVNEAKRGLLDEEFFQLCRNVISFCVLETEPWK